MPLVSMSSIAIIIVVITAAGRESLLTIGPALILIVLVHNLTGYTLGYWCGRLFKMSERDCRPLQLKWECRMADWLPASPKKWEKMATVGLAPAVFGPLMNVTGSILASYGTEDLRMKKRMQIKCEEC